MTPIQPISPDDIFLWEDGKWDFRKNLDGYEQHTYKKDFLLIPRGTLTWTRLIHESDVQDKPE